MITVRRKTARDRVDGVLLLDKPAGVTSNGALQAAKRLLNAAKGGHTGTLDPLATGLLPLCFGEATKFAQSLLDADKAYSAVLELGVTTTTGDAEGEVLARTSVALSPEQVEAVLDRFRGCIEQIPPMYSALKHNGHPLHELARRGIEVDREPRRVRIDALVLRCVEGSRIEIDVRCSKGTYVRTLATDIGAALGCGAHLRQLRRTAIGTLTLAQAVTLDRLETSAPAERMHLLLRVDALLADLPALELDADAGLRFLQGQAVELPLVPARCRAYVGGRFVGLGAADATGRLAPRRLVTQSGSLQPTCTGAEVLESQ